MKLIKKHKLFLYCLLLSFGVLLFTSKNSFLYVFNDWEDINAFFTVGKSMMKGIVPYRDLFEQKGLILYVIYGIGYLLSNSNFNGIFILEIINFSFFLYYANKIIEIYLDKKYSYVLLAILAVITTTIYSFVQGGSCEEFTLPYLIVSLYYFIKHFKIKELNNKEIMINGAMAGIVFMMKFTIVGLFIGFVFFIFLEYIRKKEFKKGLLFCIKYLMGMFVPISLCIIYLLLNGAFIDFYNIYFKINITAYQIVSTGNIFDRILEVISCFYAGLTLNGKFFLFLILIFPVALFDLNKDNRRLSFYIICLFLFMGLGIYYGLWGFIYYPLPFVLFILFSIILVVKIFKYYLDKLMNTKKKYLINISVFILSLFFCYMGANFKDELWYTKKDYFQFKYADYINKVSNPTIINANSLDVGVYTTANIFPVVKYFEDQNISRSRYSVIKDSIEKYIRDGETTFVVYIVCKGETLPEYVYDNYSVVYMDDTIYEGYFRRVYLLELKNKCPLNK